MEAVDAIKDLWFVPLLVQRGFRVSMLALKLHLTYIMVCVPSTLSVNRMQIEEGGWGRGGVTLNADGGGASAYGRFKEVKKMRGKTLLGTQF